MCVCIGYVKVIPEKGAYLPIIHGMDLWLLERNFILLNETIRDLPLNLTLTFRSLSPLYWMIQSQLNDVWNPQDAKHMNPLLVIQSQSKRETFMFKVKQSAYTCMYVHVCNFFL